MLSASDYEAIRKAGKATFRVLAGNKLSCIQSGRRITRDEQRAALKFAARLKSVGVHAKPATLHKVYTTDIGLRVHCPNFVCGMPSWHYRAGEVTCQYCRFDFEIVSVYHKIPERNETAVQLKTVYVKALYEVHSCPECGALDNAFMFGEQVCDFCRKRYVITLNQSRVTTIA